MGREWHGWHDMNPCNGKSESASSQQCSGLEDLLLAAPREEWREQTQLSHSLSLSLSLSLPAHSFSHSASHSQREGALWWSRT